MKKFEISKHLNFGQMYSEGKEFLLPSLNRESYIVTDTEIKKDSKDLLIELLYSGNSDFVPIEILDEMLVLSDSSENLMRPFRWYKFCDNVVADTNDEKDLDFYRKLSFQWCLDNLDCPEIIYLYKIKILNKEFTLADRNKQFEESLAAIDKWKRETPQEEQDALFKQYFDTEERVVKEPDTWESILQEYNEKSDFNSLKLINFLNENFYIPERKYDEE